MKRFCFILLIILLILTGCNEVENENSYEDDIKFLQDEIGKLNEKNQQLEITIDKLNNDINKLYNYYYYFSDKDIADRRSYGYIQALPYYSSVFGIIKDYDTTNNVIYFDEIEWVTSNDKERIKELGLEDENFYYPVLYNEDKSITQYIIKDDIGFYLLNEEQIVEISTHEIFVEKLSECSILCNITFCGEEIVDIMEIYYP